MNETRRNFMRKTVGASAVAAAGKTLTGMSAESYNRVKGANNRIRVAVAGVNARGNALAVNFAALPDCDVVHVIDVDSRASTKCVKNIEKSQSFKPRVFGDIRKSLESKDYDVLVVAMPDHWHAPATLMALQADKHVYLEKPCSHSPAEGELLVAAAKKYKKCVQMGNQRRSFPNIVQAMEEVRSGAIGRVYFGKGWYARNRAPIGVGKVTTPPDWLNWDLWQGPAPRKEFKDNLIHYNWHWFWHWGTGEALNNGTHMVDLVRWGLGVDYPVKVSSHGGRLVYNDDWETPDTQTINWEFENRSIMTWEGFSCYGRGQEGQSVGVILNGDKGSLHTGANGYTIFDLGGKVVRTVKTASRVDATDSQNPSGKLDVLHIRNLFEGIREGKSLNADVESGHKSTLLVQLGNIAQRVGHTLNIDPATGHIINDPEAQKLWSRSYEPGWEMKI
jgi:predicted dehydrogenase